MCRLRRHDGIVAGADLCKICHDLNVLQFIAGAFQLLMDTIEVNRTLLRDILQIRPIRDSQARLF